MNAKTLLLLLAALGSARCAPAIERWDVFEITLPGPTSGNPYCDVQWSATFSQGDERVTVPGFWDGSGVYKVRFSPPALGSWQYETRSSRPELNGKNGSFTVGPPSGNNHGPVQMFQTFYLRYADGSPYHQFGTTCYAWVHQPSELQEQTLKTLAAAPFNKIRFCVFPKSYAYNQNEPEFFAFKKGADGKFDFNQPDPAFWQHFERRILDLQKLGIEADLILWHPYDRWGFKQMSDEQDDRYLRYCIARLAAFRNVWWSLANEYDFMSDLDARHHGIKTMDDWDRFFSILQKEDPYARMRGIHNGSIWYDHTKDWVIHASLQTSDMNGGVRFREKYQKPVIYDECKYEGNIPQGWGNLDAKTMTQRFWLGTMSGCYVGHGETYKHPEDILWWAKGGVLHGESPKRIQWLKELINSAPTFHELKPLGDDQGRFLLAKPGEYYLAYCLNTRPQTVELAGNHPYKVDVIDPWAMTVTPAGTARPGAFTVNPPKADTVFRFTPYAAGESLRPEARIEATPTEGMPPLAVAFKAVTEAAQAEWDFGDGTKAVGREAKHTFTQPGVHTVTLKVTDPNGANAVAYIEVLTDRDVTQPIARIGFAAEELPALKLNGTAKRGADGALRLPDGAPWGWAQAGDQPLPDLRGLRSLTISGWLRPASLETGMGGNRIVHCLNRDTDGIDFVSHADGRLRLAVNEWPDGIKNDSSPGKLVVGKWTFVAVTYDASQSQDNVSWYFSPPLDAPGAGDVRLDRTTTYNHGSVGTDIGPLVIGNFNETMHSYGLDRQFRGEIRGLQIFGSRVSGRGALDQATLEGLLSAGRQGRNQSGAAAPDKNQREIASSCAITVAGRASTRPSLAARSAPLLAAATASAENWPQFRGPTGQGHSTETGLPLKWSATENVVWKTAIPGESWSSPIVWGDRAFVTTATDNGQSCRVVALERKSGAIAWNKEVFRQVPGHKQGRNTYATPTPATDGERVVACFGDGSFAALNFAGDVVWTDRNYPHYSEHGLASSLLLYRGLLIMARDGSSDGQDKLLGWQEPWDRAFILALDVRTGQERWTARRGLSRISHGVPAIWEHDGKAELVSEAGDVVQGYSLETGQHLWSSQVIGEGKVPSTLIGEGLVFTAGGWGGRESIKAFKLGGSGDLQETNLAWEQKKGMPRVPSMLYARPYLFAITDAGIATCLKAATGEVVWQERLGGSFSASPVSAEGHIYFVSDNGETTVIEAGPEFHVLARNPLGEKVQASPALSQGQVFLRTERHLFCIGIRDPR